MASYLRGYGIQRLTYHTRTFFIITGLSCCVIANTFVSTMFGTDFFIPCDPPPAPPPPPPSSCDPPPQDLVHFDH